jgi:TolB protein
MAEVQQLTQDGKRKLAPVCLNGGQEVAYAVHDAPNLVAIKRRRLADGFEARLHPGLTAHQFDPAFSPDGRYHCFTLSATSPQMVLVIQDTHQKTEATFHPREARAVVRSPSIAPDGSRVVFSVSDVEGHQIASVNMQGQDLKRLTESAGLNSCPALSPDGRQIAFASSRDGKFEIYVMNADGTQVRRLTKTPGLSVRPSWSPDGRRLTFTGNQAGGYAIYIMNADGSGLRRVSEPSDRVDYATWHPDGRHLLTVCERRGKFDLYLFEIPA